MTQVILTVTYLSKLHNFRKRILVNVSASNTQFNVTVSFVTVKIPRTIKTNNLTVSASLIVPTSARKKGLLLIIMII